MFSRRDGSFARSSTSPSFNETYPATGWSVSALISVRLVTAVSRRRDSSGSASRKRFDRISLDLLESTSGRLDTLGGFHGGLARAEDYGAARTTQPQCRPKTT